jgi:hypothetical protein
MKIYVQPRNGDSFKRVVRQAIDLLHEAEIVSAQPDDSDSTLLVAPDHLPDALSTLERAGLRTRID